jgi:hypothetical protein
VNEGQEDLLYWVFMMTREGRVSSMLNTLVIHPDGSKPKERFDELTSKSFPHVIVFDGY